MTSQVDPIVLLKLAERCEREQASIELDRRFGSRLRRMLLLRHLPMRGVLCPLTPPASTPP